MSDDQTDFPPVVENQDKLGVYSMYLLYNELMSPLYMPKSYKNLTTVIFKADNYLQMPLSHDFHGKMMEFPTHTMPLEPMQYECIYQFKHRFIVSNRLFMTYITNLVAVLNSTINRCLHKNTNPQIHLLTSTIRENIPVIKAFFNEHTKLNTHLILNFAKITNGVQESLNLAKEDQFKTLFALKQDNKDDADSQESQDKVHINPKIIDYSALIDTNQEQIKINDALKTSYETVLNADLKFSQIITKYKKNTQKISNMLKDFTQFLTVVETSQTGLNNLIELQITEFNQMYNEFDSMYDMLQNYHHLLKDNYIRSSLSKEQHDTEALKIQIVNQGNVIKDIMSKYMKNNQKVYNWKGSYAHQLSHYDQDKFQFGFDYYTKWNMYHFLVTKDNLDVLFKLLLEENERIFLFNLTEAEFVDKSLSPLSSDANIKYKLSAADWQTFRAYTRDNYQRYVRFVNAKVEMYFNLINWFKPLVMQVDLYKYMHDSMVKVSTYLTEYEKSVNVCKDIQLSISHLELVHTINKQNNWYTNTLIFQIRHMRYVIEAKTYYKVFGYTKLNDTKTKGFEPSLMNYMDSYFKEEEEKKNQKQVELKNKQEEEAKAKAKKEEVERRRQERIEQLKREKQEVQSQAGGGDMDQPEDDGNIDDDPDQDSEQHLDENYDYNNQVPKEVL